MARITIKGLASPADINSNFEELYTQLAAVSGSIVYKPPVATYANLPSSPTIGWAYYVIADEKVYRWNGTSWDTLIDYSGLATEIDNFNHIGTYNSSTSYEINNVVNYQGNGYMCIQANNSENVHAPIDTSYWQLIAERSIAGEAWSSGTSYVVGDFAVDAGVTYICISAHSNDQPPSSNWTALAAAGDVLAPASQTTGNIPQWDSVSKTLTNGFAKSTLVQTSTDQTVNGIKTFGSLPQVPTSTPTLTTQVISKSYFDAQQGNQDAIISSKIEAVIDDTAPALGGPLDCADNITYYELEAVIPGATSNPTLNWNDGVHQKYTLSVSTTFSFTPPTIDTTDSAVLILLLTYSATIGAVNWPTSVKWMNVTEPSLTKTSGAVD